MNNLQVCTIELVRVEIRPGTHISEAVKEINRIAIELKCAVSFRFNGRKYCTRLGGGPGVADWVLNDWEHRGSRVD